ncbi:MAG: DegV family protein [Acutalibacteraceae bacterium]|jgi:DegV family protein with EDD domain
MSIKIFTDSSTDLTQKWTGQINVIPIAVRFGDTEYLDGQTIDTDEFYKKLENSDVLPTTSQVSPSTFENIFEEVTQNGDQAIVITISSKLSGTFQSACIAAEKYPNVRIVDSLNVTIGAGVLVQYAAECVAAGMELNELAEHLVNIRENVKLIALVDTLEYLKKGGRISKTVAFAGGLLNIKPIISVAEGELALIGKARGTKQGNSFLIEKIKELGVDYAKPILLGYTGLSDQLLQSFIGDSNDLWSELDSAPAYTQIGSVVGTHAGPGAIAAAFFKKD